MKSSLNAFYKDLHSHFGRQHWWPAKTKFEVMIGAILTQNTSWSNVEKAIDNLRGKNLLQPSKLYSLPRKQLASLIRPAGYYNIKARRLKEFVKFLHDSCRGNIKRLARQETYALRRQLLAVHGIGQETADSMLLYALNKPIFVVDAYTRRILARHYLIKEGFSYEEVQNLFMRNHVRNSNKSYRKSVSNVVKLFNEYHALIVKLGKDFCRKLRPKCGLCPLKNYRHKTD